MKLNVEIPLAVFGNPNFLIGGELSCEHAWNEVNLIFKLNLTLKVNINQPPKQQGSSPRWFALLVKFGDHSLNG